MTFFLVALAWALPSFLLHNVLHEGAHAVFALASGATNVKPWPFPGWKLGYFTWAHMSYDGTLSDVNEAEVSAAPVPVETVWFGLFVALFYFVPFGWWSAFLAVECVSSLIDMTVWFLGFWRPTENVQSDAAKVRRLGNFSRGVGKAASLSWMLPLVGVAVGLAVFKFR